MRSPPNNKETAPAGNQGGLKANGSLEGKTKKILKTFRELRPPLSVKVTDHAPKVRVTDHAILRYLERTGRIDREAIEREILSPSVVAVASATGGGETRHYDPQSGFIYVIAQGEIVSLWRRT